MPPSNDLNLLTIEQLFSENSHYIIPIYQRNYAWGPRRSSSLLGILPMLLSIGLSRSTSLEAWSCMFEITLIARIQVK